MSGETAINTTRRTAIHTDFMFEVATLNTGERVVISKTLLI